MIDKAPFEVLNWASRKLEQKSSECECVSRNKENSLTGKRIRNRVEENVHSQRFNPEQRDRRIDQTSKQIWFNSKILSRRNKEKQNKKNNGNAQVTELLN